LGLRDHRDKRVLLALLVQLDSRDLLEIQALLEQQEHQDRLVLKDHKARKVRRDLPDPREL